MFENLSRNGILRAVPLSTIEEEMLKYVARYGPEAVRGSLVVAMHKSRDQSVSRDDLFALLSSAPDIDAPPSTMFVSAVRPQVHTNFGIALAARLAGYRGLSDKMAWDRERGYIDSLSNRPDRQGLLLTLIGARLLQSRLEAHSTDGPALSDLITALSPQLTAADRKAIPLLAEAESKESRLQILGSVAALGGFAYWLWCRGQPRPQSVD